MIYDWWWHTKEWVQKHWCRIGKRRCLGPDCHRYIKPPTMYCGFECACYDGVFNVRTGWNEAAVRRKHPKEWQHCHNIVMKKLSEWDT